MAKWTFFHTQGDLNDPGGVYTAVPFGIDQLPGIAGAGQQLVVSSLFINGVSQLPFGDISGHVQMAFGTAFNGDGANDVLWMNSGDTHNTIIWDDRTTNDPGNVNPNGRYGLPGGQVGQETASIEVIRGGDVDVAGTINDVISDDFINLSYNTIDGGLAYNLAITIYGGTGRDLVVSGEGDDVIYGGNEDDNLGDGLLGMGGNDTLYGGINNTSTGADDLFGYAGDDTIFGANNGDVYYGDQGNDVIYSAQAFATDQGSGLAIGNVDTVTLFGGDGDDLMIAGRNGSAVVGLRGMEFFFGGNMVSDWVDAEYFQTANGQDNSLNDTVSYANATAAATVDLETANFDANNDNLQYGTGAGAAVNDRFYGIEHLIGGNFNDFLTGSSVANRLEGGQGNDTLFGEAGSDTLIGGLGDDTIDAGADNDLVLGEAGSDSLTGGTGIDTLSYSTSAAAVNVTLGGAGSGGDAQGDTVAADFENLVGSAFNDTLIGDALNNSIFGLAGNDFIQGGAGGDSLVGGGGIDTLSYSSSNVGVQVTLGGSGTGGHAQGDTVADDFEVLLGSTFGDLLRGRSAQATTILGGQGNDTVEGGSAADSLDGGAGTGDFLSYEHSSAGVNVTLSNNILANGDAQGDTISGFENLIGSAQGDGLTGDGLGSNTIYGGLGNDAVDGLAGNDTLYGGAGQDFVIYGNSPTFGVTVDLSLNTATGGLDNDRLFEIEHVSGSNFNDTLIGDGLANSLVGLAGADILSGGAATDSLFGGAGADTLVAGANSTTGATTTVSGWDGVAGSAAINVSVAAGATVASDFAFGGSETDTLDIQQGSGRNIYNTPNASIPSFLAGVEIIIAGAAADVINLTFNDGVTRSAYGENVTIYAAGGADLVFSGSGADLIVGGQSVAGADAGDTLYGGQGNDTIFGDDFNVDDTTGGGDTLSGGLGLDTVMGGGGNDTISDSDGGLLYGGHGADVVVLIGADGLDDYLASGGFVEIGGSINPNAATDGNDRVFVGGSYNSIQSDLGAGDDLFIASSSPLGSGFKTDVVTGGTGSDVISSWSGDDLLYGDYDPSDTSGNGNGDALWGGAGVDTIYGGPGQDVLYGGEGDGDLLIGGDGSDYYYWARTDGVDLIDDQDPVLGGEGDNYILVFAGYDATSQLPAGTGVFETDHDLYDNAGGDDMVQLVDLDGAGAGTMYRLTILQGAGAGSSIEFDQTEISVIGLWNHDATGSTPVITAYVWDPVDGRYEYQA